MAVLPAKPGRGPRRHVAEQKWDQAGFPIPGPAHVPLPWLARGELEVTVRDPLALWGPGPDPRPGQLERVTPGVSVHPVPEPWPSSSRVSPAHRDPSSLGPLYHSCAPGRRPEPGPRPPAPRPRLGHARSQARGPLPPRAFPTPWKKTAFMSFTTASRRGRAGQDEPELRPDTGRSALAPRPQGGAWASWQPEAVHTSYRRVPSTNFDVN